MVKLDVGANEYDVRILGGEPTQHSNFTGIIDTIIKRGLKVNLVSNFLFGEKIQKTIHPQPMGGQGEYAFVSLQNQGYLMVIST